MKTGTRCIEGEIMVGKLGSTYVKGRGIVYLDTRWVVPYNPYLSLKCEAYINVEVCATVQSVKEFHKYISKCSDRAIVELSADNNEVDEIKQYPSLQRLRLLSLPRLAFQQRRSIALQ
jgi:hypothetical protein